MFTCTNREDTKEAVDEAAWLISIEHSKSGVDALFTDLSLIYKLMALSTDLIRSIARRFSWN